MLAPSATEGTRKGLAGCRPRFPLMCVPADRSLWPASPLTPRRGELRQARLRATQGGASESGRAAQVQGHAPPRAPFYKDLLLGCPQPPGGLGDVCPFPGDGNRGSEEAEGSDWPAAGLERGHPVSPTDSRGLAMSGVPDRIAPWERLAFNSHACRHRLGGYR